MRHYTLHNTLRLPSYSITLSHTMLHYTTYRSYDREIALERLRTAGAILTTSEAAIFDLMRTADYERFKDISKLVKLKNSEPHANDFK